MSPGRPAGHRSGDVDAPATIDLTGDLDAGPVPATVGPALFALVDQPVALVDCAGGAPRFSAANDAYRALLARPGADVVGSRLDELLPPALAGEAVRRVLDVASTRRARHDEDRVDMPTGTMRLESTIVPVGSDEDEQVLVVFSDHRSEDDAAASLETAARAVDQLGAIVENTTDFVGICAPDGRFVYLNAAARHVHGLGPDDDLSSLHVLDIYTMASRRLFLTEVVPLVQADGHWSGELTIRTRDAEVHVLQSITAHHDESGQVDYFSSIARDITERKAFERQLEHHALHDRLTGLPNRILFMDRLEQALARSRRTGVNVAVLFLDVDRFQVVNDSLGHDAGDAVLRSLAGRLGEVVRPSDTIARFGGDEFAVLCEGLPGQGVVVAERIREALEPPFLLDEGEVFLTVSIGVSGYDSISGVEPEGLVRDADVAMFRAKEQGRNRYELFDENLRAHTIRRLQTESELRRALDGEELTVHFQPLISLEQGNVVGVEALARWPHPERGLLAAEEFVPVAEESGLVVQLGEHVLRTACAEAAVWKSRNPGRAPTVWVNLSAHHLTHLTLLETLERVLGESGLDPTRLGVEITETALMADAETAAHALASLKQLGVGVAIDDFGTGYSSMAYLKRFPVTTLKVDRSFIDGLGRAPEDSAIVNAQVSMSHALGLSVIAEGVESEVQFAQLRRLGCDLAQGYFFSRPLPGEELRELLALDPSW